MTKQANAKAKASADKLFSPFVSTAAQRPSWRPSNTHAAEMTESSEHRSRSKSAEPKASSEVATTTSPVSA